MKKALILSIAAAAMAAAPAAFAQGAPAAGVQAAVAPAASEAVATLQKACLPILRGGPVKPAAQAAGFKLENGGWVLPVGAKQEIDLSPPDHMNPHVCTLSITAAPADGAAMRSALGTWASAQSPPLQAVAVDQSVPGAQQSWVTSTWSAQTPRGAESVVLTQPAGPAAGQNVAQPSTLLVSITPT